MENGKLGASLFFVVGIAIGSNWPKIKNIFPEVSKITRKYFEIAAENVEDTSKKLYSQLRGKEKAK